MKKGTTSKSSKLDDIHKFFVVQKLACYDTPLEVANALKLEFGIEVTPQTMEYYNPTRKAGKALIKRWADLFEQTRADYLANAQNYIPIANKTVRLGEMQKAYRAHKDRGNWVQALEVLEQVAKEVGEAFTNKRELTGKDGAPLTIATTTIDSASLSVDAMAELLAVYDAKKSDD